MDERNELEVYEGGNDEMETTEKKSGGLGKLIVGGVAVAVGIVAWVKSKSKRKARQIKKLEKEGYIVIAPSEAEVEESEEDSE